MEHFEREGGQALLVEFSGEQGQTYALVPVHADQLIILHRKTEAA